MVSATAPTPIAARRKANVRRAPQWLRSGLVCIALCGAGGPSSQGAESSRTEAFGLPSPRPRMTSRPAAVAVPISARQDGRRVTPMAVVGQNARQPPPPEPDPAKLLQQLFGGAAGGQNSAGSMPGFGVPGDPNAPANPFASMMGGMPKEKPKATDAWFTDRFPFLAKAKMILLPGFFFYCFYRGWIGRWGLLMGLFSKSYFDALAVPLRVLPDSPGFGKAYIVCQFYVDSAFKLVGYLINVAKGKATFPPKFPGMTMPAGDSSAANPFANFGAAQNAGNAWATPTTATAVPTNMPPTAPTVVSPPPSPTPAQPRPQGPPSRSQAPIVDADVRFLD